MRLCFGFSDLSIFIFRDGNHITGALDKSLVDEIDAFLGKSTLVNHCEMAIGRKRQNTFLIFINRLLKIGIGNRFGHGRQ